MISRIMPNQDNSTYESHYKLNHAAAASRESRTYLIISSFSPKVEIAFIESFRSLFFFSIIDQESTE